jgi:hypothetical protein
MSLEARVVELHRLPVNRTVRMPHGGLHAGRGVFKRFSAPNDPGCGVIEGSQAFGGSVPEGYRSWMVVVLPDALVEVEEYDDTPDANTFARVHAPTEARADELEAALRSAEAG